ncbi:MAG: Rrf2 family transcriptional regulator [Deltaproteobacteria bacterium]|nr:Rrf2 family transcriptional regulator [Deltaproteobacteria bacterium]NIS76060.1 Rrf2 family transcriptional regulator [Deltaproteobacteria bacterium]
MKVSKKFEYALRALLFMAGRENEKTFLIKDIAEANGIPKKFLELILLDLKNAGILTSKRGVSGGYRFFVPPAEVTVLDVYRAIEGEVEPTECIRLGNVECETAVSPECCAIRSLMGGIKELIEEEMGAWSIKKMADHDRELRARSAENFVFHI